MLDNNNNIPYQCNSTQQRVTYRCLARSALCNSWDFVTSLLLVIMLLNKTHQFLHTIIHNQAKYSQQLYHHPNVFSISSLC